MKKTSLFKSTTKNGVETLNETGIENQNQLAIDLSSLSSNKNTKSDITSTANLEDLLESSGVTDSNNQTSNKSEFSTSVNLGSTARDIRLLPGTTEYFGILDIVSILGEKPEFTLQDSKGNYFAYYGKHLNFIQTVQKLGGNVYEMVTEREILQNQLFGDRVSYINLSAFKDIRVIMVIEIDGDTWLLQIPTDKYHQSKDYLKSLFIH